MKVSSALLGAILLCLVMQSVTSRQLKFKTFGGDGDSEGSLSGSGGGGGDSGSGSWDSCGKNCNRTNSTSWSSGGRGSNSTKEFNETKYSDYNKDDDNSTHADADEAERDSKEHLKSSNGYNFWFAGKSGLVKIAQPGGGYLTVKFRKLSDAQHQKADNFEDADWKWTGPTASTCSGLNCSIFSASSSVRVQTKAGERFAKFSVTALLFNEAGTIPYGNVSLPVDTTSVKFSYNVTGWPWAAKNGSYLYLAVTVASDGNGLNASGEGVSVGNGSLNTPNFAYVDDVEAPIDILYGKDSDGSKGCQGYVIFKFPQFENLYYDPVALPTGTAAAASAGGGSTTVIVVSDTPSPTTNTVGSTPSPTSKKGALGNTVSLFAILLAGFLALLM